MSKAEIKRVKPQMKSKRRENYQWPRFHTWPGNNGRCFHLHYPIYCSPRHCGYGVTSPWQWEKWNTSQSQSYVSSLTLCLFLFSHYCCILYLFLLFLSFFLCYNILCCDKYLLSSSWQQLQRFFHPISPSPMPFLTLWATVSLYDPWGLKLCQWYHLQIPQHL